MDLARALAERLDKVLETDDPNQTLSARWSQLLQAREQSGDLYLALSVMLQQSEDLLAEIGSAPRINERAKRQYHNAVMRMVPFIHPARVESLQVKHLIEQKDNVDLLFMASDGLSSRLVPDVPKATLESLCKELEKLKEDVREADVPPEIKRLIIASLDTLLMALRSYELLGAEVVTRIYGSVAAELARVQGDKSTPKEASGLLKRTVKLVRTVGALVVWAGATVSGAHELLTYGPQIVEEVEVLTGAAPSQVTGTTVAISSQETKQGNEQETPN